MTTIPSIDRPGTAQIWSGQDYAAAFRHAADWLAAHRDEVNALNVFPVPDGDTGTNMAMTMSASVNGLVESAETVAEVARQIAHGALLGARGNSGVILSQIFRGMAIAVEDRQTLDGRDLAASLRHGQEMAYKAVMRPVEGTMLTVIRGAADRATVAASRSSSLHTVLAEAIAGAQEALDSTPDLLDILKQAGVVDAGGRGVVLILQGLQRYAHGTTDIDEAEINTGAPGRDMAFLDDLGELHGEDAFGYCTNFMVFGANLAFDTVRADIAAMGQSAVIVGDDTMVKVHIHTEDPGEVLAYAVKLGNLDQIKIDNMSFQTEALSEQRATAKSPASPQPDEPITGATAVVAVASGDGLADALRAMGANRIVSGGQTMNPSTEDLLSAVEALPVDQVILLPNNKNIVMAANQVPSLSSKTVRVVPTISVPHALAALAEYNVDATLDQNVDRMQSALDDACALELTRAVRDVELDGMRISTGQVIGLINDKLTVAADTIAQAIRQLFDQIDSENAELITVFSGCDATSEDEATLKAVIEDLCPDAESEFHTGGQPHYLFIIGVE